VRQLKDILERTTEDLEAFTHPRVSVAWQDLDLVYWRVYNPIPEFAGHIVGKRIEDIVENKEVATELSEAKRKVIETGKSYHQAATIVMGGRSYIFDLSIEPTYDDENQIDGLMTICVDITDLIQAKEHLAKANERLIKLLDDALGPH